MHLSIICVINPCCVIWSFASSTSQRLLSIAVVDEYVVGGEDKRRNITSSISITQDVDWPRFKYHLSRSLVMRGVYIQNLDVLCSRLRAVGLRVGCNSLALVVSVVNLAYIVLRLQEMWLPFALCVIIFACDICYVQID